MSEVSVAFWARSGWGPCVGRWRRVRRKWARTRLRESPFDALGSPLGGDPATGQAPDFFGVRLEEDAVELTAEAVDEEVFESGFGPARPEDGEKVAEASVQGAAGAKIVKSGEREADGIVEEASQEVDAAFAAAKKQDAAVVGGLFGERAGWEGAAGAVIAEFDRGCGGHGTLR